MITRLKEKYKAMLRSLADQILVYILLLLFSAPTLHVHGNLNCTTTAWRPIPAVFAFGDSIVDSGNNDAIVTFTKCNFPPYGQDFVDRRPTGRFSNGRIPPDFIDEMYDQLVLIMDNSIGNSRKVIGAPLHAASFICVKDLVPAYLGTDLKSDDLLTGVSFGSGGTGFDPLTPVLVSVLSMSKQLDLFVEYKERLKEIAGEDTAASIVAESLYLVCAGSNDILNNFYLGVIRRLQYDISSYVDFLIQRVSDFVHQLYQHGARKIAIVGLPPLGCLPLQRTLFGGPKRDCEASRNRAALLFNSMLEKYIFRLQAELKCQTIGYVNIYEILLDIIRSPQNFGFEEATKGCCGTGNFEVSFLCNSITASTCVDDTKFVFWDSVHPTQQAYKIIVDYVFPRYVQKLL